jgi:hypothetical protein
VEPTTAAVAVATTTDNMNPIVRAFSEGGFVMYIILVIAVLTVFLIVERFLTLRSLRLEKKEFADDSWWRFKASNFIL